MARQRSGTAVLGRVERIVVTALFAGATITAAASVIGAVADAVAATLGNAVTVTLVSGDERPGTGIVSRIAFPEAAVTADLSDGPRVLIGTMQARVTELEQEMRGLV